MGFTSDVTMRLNKGVFARTVTPAVARQYILSAQRIVASAAKRSNHPYKDQTGNNTRRIGWAASGPNQTRFGTLTTQGAGTTDSAGAGKTSKQGDVSVMVATSSGYGGYLEVGTRRMKKTTGPYIYPAVKRDMPKLRKGLTKVV